MPLPQHNPTTVGAARPRADLRVPDAGRLLAFWLPLVLTSVLVALSGPALNATLGRSPDPTRDLAAFWVAFTIVLFVESAALAVQPAALALGAGRGSLRRAAPVALAIGAVSSLGVLALASPAPSGFVFGALVPTSARVAALASAVLVVLSPLPLLVAVRGLAAAVALRRGGSTLVAAGAALRVGVIVVVVAAGLAGGAAPGALAAAWALLAGTAAETALLAAAAWPIARAGRRLGAPTGDGSAMPGRGVLRVLVPLVVASAAWTATRPLVNAVLGRLADPEAAQAAFGAALPVLMITCAPLWALQEATVVLPRGPGDLAKVARFAAVAALAFTAGIAVLAFTPFGGTVLGAGFGVPPAMRETLAPALAVLALEPLVLAARAFAHGVLLRARRTGAFLAFAPLRLAAMLAAGLAATAAAPHANGAVLGIALVVGGDLVDAGLCAWRARAVVRAEGLPAAPGADAAAPADAGLAEAA